jgi:hypothetical protein
MCSSRVKLGMCLARHGLVWAWARLCKGWVLHGLGLAWAGLEIFSAGHGPVWTFAFHELSII